MNTKNLLQKEKEGSLTDADWEYYAASFLQKKFDNEKKEQWAQKLAQQGILREKASGNIKTWSASFQWMKIAAGLALLVAAVWVVFNQQALPAEQKFAMQFLEQPFYPNEGGTRGSASIDQSRGKAIEAYQNGEYEKVLNYLSAMEAQGAMTAADYFQAGLCNMYRQKPDYEAALKAFNLAKTKNPTELTDEINWYSALALVMNGENARAKALLQLVTQSPSSRQQQEARQLQDILNKR